MPFAGIPLFEWESKAQELGDEGGNLDNLSTEVPVLFWLHRVLGSHTVIPKRNYKGDDRSCLLGCQAAPPPPLSP